MNDRQLQAFRLHKSGMTYKEIGKAIGVSGERARQLARRAEEQYLFAFRALERQTRSMAPVDEFCDVLREIDLSWTIEDASKAPAEIKLKHKYSYWR